MAPLGFRNLIQLKLSSSDMKCIIQLALCKSLLVTSLQHCLIIEFFSCCQLLCGWSKPGEIIWKISSRWWTYVYGWMACVCLLNAQILNDWISLKNYPCFSFLCFFISVFIRRKCQYIISHKVNKVNAILSAT